MLFKANFTAIFFVALRKSFLWILILKEKKLLNDERSFTLLSQSVGYTGKVLPGKYRLKNKMTNYQLVRLLKSGKQEPVKLIVKGSQSFQNFLEYTSENLELSFDELNRKLTDKKFLKQYNHLYNFRIKLNIIVNKFIIKIH